METAKNTEETMIDGRETPDAELLMQGKVPHNAETRKKLSVGIEFLTDFWEEKYLKEYIAAGGSKMKFVTGRPGSGKSFLLNRVMDAAAGQNYAVASFSAEEIWLHDFKEIYVEILRQCDILKCLRGCASEIIRLMGVEEDKIPEGMTFMDYLAQQDMGDALTRREIRLQLKKMFLEDPLLDNNFALACSLLTGGLLGHPLLEQKNQELLLAWLGGDRTVKLSMLRALGLSPSRITKYNARHMLRSLARVIHLAGYSGLLVVIDDLEILLNRSSLKPIHYTKLRREDTYESIRQLIDDIDSMRNIMFVFGFDRDLLDNDNYGIKSYQALWMRIQSEIAGKRFNCFADIVDMDAMGQQIFTAEKLVKMADALKAVLDEEGVKTNSVSPESVEQIFRQSRLGGIGIPGMINKAVLGGEGNV